MQKTTDIGTEVTVTQTETRAILSWETFNIGRETTLVFDQKRDGTAQTDWVALNRWQLRIWWKPFVTLIWGGGIMIALGGAMALVGRVRRSWTAAFRTVYA